jgi:hypothetical protein
LPPATTSKRCPSSKQKLIRPGAHAGRPFIYETQNPLFGRTAYP